MKVLNIMNALQIGMLEYGDC